MRKSLQQTLEFIAFLACLACAGCTTLESEKKKTPEPSDISFFRSSVKPLFEHRCVHCHSHRAAKAGLNFQDRDGLLGSKRRFIVPGASGQSLIFRAVTLESAHPNVMPGDGWGISDSQEESLRRWIDAGAKWPQGRAGQINRKTYRVEIDDL